ncbi:hypothetical protein ACGF1Z_08385 [Streptomyces sp. NPDC048018]|uniref:hypothetical protein n=1 Tax=Streptomyces sp. NPDC048018 TaxID=3365499 RepID=UPI003711A082
MSNLNSTNRPPRALAAALLLAAGTVLGAGATSAQAVPVDLPGGGLVGMLGVGAADAGPQGAGGGAQSAVIGGNASEQSIGS